MQTFGFPAFVKLLSLHDSRQATELKRRLNPVSTGGYDFHKQMRKLARRYILGREPLANLLPVAAAITNAAEARSALAALRCLEAWHSSLTGETQDFAPAIYESPAHLFRVRFEPAFGLYIAGRPTAIEIWNTMKPSLAAGPTYAALSIAAEAYYHQGVETMNTGLLSLQDPVRLYLLTDVPRQTALAASLVGRIEEVLRSPPPTLPRPEDRPTA
jgi:hypothetical protein